MLKKALLLVGISLLGSVSAEIQNYAKNPKGKAFIAEMTGQFGYQQAELEKLFEQVKPSQSILEKISRPKEKTLPWFKYQRIFSDSQRSDNGAAFYRRHQAVLAQAYQQYGVPPSIIVAILGVETRYGKVMGNDFVIQALATIAFDYPKREAFFTKELRAFLQMSKENGFDPLALKGSYAGAMGMAQFMPSSYLHYAVDYEGDGKKDLWQNPADAIFSIANYLAENGWQRDQVIVDTAVLSQPYHGQLNHKPFTVMEKLQHQGIDSKNVQVDSHTPTGLLKLDGENQPLYFITFKNFAVITTYNTSPMYAMAVFELAKSIEARL